MCKIEELKKYLKDTYALNNVSFSKTEIKSILFHLNKKSISEYGNIISKDLIKKQREENKFKELIEILKNQFNLNPDLKLDFNMKKKLSYMSIYDLAKIISDEILFNQNLELFKHHLINDFGWKDPIFNFVHIGWIEDYLKELTPFKAAEKYNSVVNNISKSVALEWQAKHSAMSPAAVKAYSDNYN